MEELDEFMTQSNARARRGRRVARTTFGGVIWVLLLVGFLFVAAPDGPSVPIVGLLGLAAGLIWMVRILRADPEPDTSAWRYRDG